ncbi:hypothetical protein Poli38472_007328 [Pythium oligandrum]|uniref:Multiple inositol polyphosphate phosphatase 1 n=1 Tax=Pythium oligandrum TaxID=41045 RepID=A0A8K1CAL3_PYTOL|nr:hypothetical protein Poli38472_007328 [Pythium oligandrum]|eukprot:TMW59183.1 hypothetical protein Poli38472_007328 [Pythium oligandrum]
MLSKTTWCAAIALASAASVATAAKFQLETAMATKTAYWDQSKDPLDVFDEFVEELEKEDEDKYSLVQIQSVVRHGTRYPTKSNIKEIDAFLKMLQTNYSSVIPSWMRTYQLPYNVSIEGILSSTGSTELKNYGQRMRLSVGKSIPVSYSSDKFVLQHTYKSRTKDSATSFASVFFQNAANVTYIEHPEGNDRLLRFFDECPRYTRDVADNENATSELTQYKSSSAMLKTVDILRSKLNLPSTAPLTVADVETAYSACSFDLALFHRKDNWCTIVTEDLVKAVEYAEDLETYYTESHGYKINYEIASVLLRDIVQYMTDFTQNKTSVVGNFRFAHGETTMPLMTLLGYVDRTKLRADFSPRAIEKRKFRTSRLALFMANLEFRLYQKKRNGEFYVQVRVNELPTEIPGCDDVFCKLSEVQDIWKTYLESYDFDKECSV